MSALDSEGIPAPPRTGPWPRPRARVGRCGPPGSVANLGHLRTILRDGPINAYLSWAKDLRQDYVIWTGATPRVIAIEPDSIRRILFAGDDFVRNTDAVQTMFGKSLLRLDGAPWKRRRALYAEAFRGVSLEPAVGITQDETETLIARWHDRGPVSFRPARELSFCLLRILGRVVFGFEFDNARHGGRPLHRAMVTLATDAVMRHFMPGPLVSLKTGGEVANARRHLDHLAAEILAEGGDTPFMSALRGALATGEIDRCTAIDEVRTFLIAGQETSATAMAWALAVLAEQGEAAAMVRSEGQRAATMTRQAELLELEHSTRWVKEVLRLYPAVPMTTTLAARDVSLGRLDIPQGTRVDVSCYVQHRLPWLWDEPDRFDPSRFATPPPFGSFLPFLLGPHTCIGMQLAMIELPLLLGRLAANFEFELPNGPPKANLRVSLHPAGLELRAHSRAQELRRPVQVAASANESQAPCPGFDDPSPLRITG